MPLLTLPRWNGPSGAYTEICGRNTRSDSRNVSLRQTASERRFHSLGMWRLIVFVAGALIAWWNYWFLPIPVAAFIRPSRYS